MCEPASQRAKRARHEQNMRGMNNSQHKLLTVKLTGELFKLTRAGLFKARLALIQVSYHGNS